MHLLQGSHQLDGSHHRAREEAGDAAANGELRLGQRLFGVVVREELLALLVTGKHDGID